MNASKPAGDSAADSKPPPKKDPSTMTLAEQLAAQREAMNAKAAGGGDKEVAKAPPPKKDPSTMTLAE